MSNEPEFHPPLDRTEDASDSSLSASEKAQLDLLRVELPEKIGRYEVISLLGRGAMGSVHLALDTQLGRQVALKVLSGTARSYRDGRERFSREAQAAAALNHPGICSIYSLEQLDDTLVLVLEYIAGKSFKELLDDPASGWPPNPKVAAGYILQAAEALRAAHAAGIVHRDVKCSNLMLTPDGRVKILDFGLAQIGGSSVLTQQGTLVGTPAYASPEQAQGETVDARSDLWSLGVVFYEVLTGRLPFAEDNINALTQAILHSEPVAVRHIRPNTPAPLGWVIQKLLAKKRDQRYPSAAALMAELAPLAGLGESDGAAQGFAAGASAVTESRSGMASLLGTSERRAVTFLCLELVAANLHVEMEEWEAALEKSRELCARVVAQHDGYAQPWMGNSVTICFGFPSAREGAAQSAVNAGLALAEVFGRSNTGFHFRGGIETSLVIADTSLAKPLSGEGFELARAFCERAGENQVYVGAETRRQVEGRFAFGTEEELAWRRGRTLRMARALHASTARSRFQASPEAPLTPLLGRDQEMQILMRHWENAVEGQGSVILLGGAAGLGKSRLTYELKRQVAQNPSAALIECFCAPQYANTALYPIIDCFDRLVFECDTKSMAQEEKLRVLEGVLAQLGFPLPETVPLFASFLGIAAPAYSALDMTPERRRALTLEALASLLVERAERQPLLFIVEDLHWVDPTTLELLRMLVDRVAGAPLFALYTHRPETVPSLPQRSHVSAISLGRLTRHDSLEMVVAASGSRKLDAGTLEQIAGNSDGVPLFLEEMTKAVVETGGSAKAGKLRVPATLRESFVARLDQLGSARDVARAAAVLGREFPEPLLEAILRMPADAFKESLERLIDAEILYVRGSGQRRTLIFKHALLQEAAYDSLLRKSRLAVHARAAELLIHEFPTMAAREPEIVAHHFSEAGLGSQAIPYWHQAGMAALQRSAYREAAHQFERGLEVYRSLEAHLREPKQELLLLTSLGPALIATEGFGASAVGETYRRAERLIETAGQTLVLPALWGVWVYSLVRSDLETALAISRQMIDSGERNSDDAMILEGHWTAGNTLFWRGDLPAARKHLEAAQAMYDPQRFDDHAYRFGQDSLVAALCYLSFVYCYLGLFEKALEASERSVARARSLRHPFSIGWSLTFRATLECFTGNYAEARNWGDEAVRYCREQAYPFWISSALAASGRSLAGMGACDEGIAHLREGIEMTRAIGSRVIEPLFRGELAETLLLRGDAEAALAEAEGAILQADEQGVRISRLDLLRIRGLALRSLDRDGEAQAAIRACLSESQAASCRLVELTAATHLAEFWRDREPLTRTLIDFPETANEPPVLRNAREVLRRN